MTRKDQFNTILSSVSDEERQIVDRLVDEVIFLEQRMDEVKRLPFVAVNPKNPQQQRTTSAAKIYKECSQSYMNAIRILLGVVRKVDASAEDELEKLLEKF